MPKDISLPPEAHPPLGKTFLAGFDKDNESFPIFAVLKDPRAGGYIAPAVGDTTGLSTEVIANFPNNKFLKAQRLSETRVMWMYYIMPGPILTTKEKSGDFNSVEVDTIEQEGLIGTIDPITSNGVLKSAFAPTSSVVGNRTSQQVASLPSDQVVPDWDFVPIPMLLFSITHNYFCNGTDQAKIVTNYDSAGGASALRKHRKTIRYSYTKPDPDLSVSAFETSDIHYTGIAISFNFNNVINDLLLYSQNITVNGCLWTEAYDFPATTPSATAWAAGMWIVRSYKVDQLGAQLWKTTTIEYYTIEGNPTI